MLQNITLRRCNHVTGDSKKARLYSFFTFRLLNSSTMKYYFLALLFAAETLANWDTYPSVPETASVNGFSDNVKSVFPKCAVDCGDFSTSNTPCPYWDTGCLCVMPQWSGEVASCIAESCTGSDVASATSLALSLCSRVGANLWMMPASISTALELAADASGGSTATSGAITSSAASSGISTTASSIASLSSSSSGDSLLTTGLSNSTSSTGSSSSLSSSWQAASGFAVLIAALMACLV